MVEGPRFAGWYEAPRNLGRTDFVLEVEMREEGRWRGRGRDLTSLTLLGTRSQEQKEFLVEGKEEEQEVTFIKNFPGDLGGISYKGKVEQMDGKISVRGQYSYKFTKLWIPINIVEDFEMSLDQ